MASPYRYQLSYDFTGFQQTNPTTPLPADKIEIEFSNIETSIGQTITNLNLIQRSDGKLNNKVVTMDSLDNTVKAALGTAIDPKGAWVTGVKYSNLELVDFESSVYICVIDHVADVFATDLADGKWMVWSYSASSEVVSGPASSVDSEIARFDGVTGKVLKAGLAVGTGAGNIVQLDGDGKLPAVDGSALTGLSLLPAGVIVSYAGSSVPDGWLLCYGQAISRSTYASLFSVIGTTYGVGDGSTTFNVPDCRGRTDVGKDNMGGTAANRLTGLTGGVNGSTLGAVGGSQSHELLLTEIPAHKHVCGAGVTPSQVNYGWVDDPLNLRPSPASNSDAQLPYTSEVGGGAVHNNVQPSIVLNKIIKHTPAVSSPGDTGGTTVPRIITSGAAATFVDKDSFIAFNSAELAAKTLTLGAPTDTQVLVVKDSYGNAATYPITITASGCTIDGGASLVIDNNYGSMSLKWDGISNWMVY